MTATRFVFAFFLLGGVTAAMAQGADVTTVEGRLEPRKVVAVGAQVNGPVAKVLVEEGEAVSQGELLARIEPTRYRARLEEAQARLAKAKAVAEDSSRQLERQEKIYNRGLSSSRDLEVAQRDAARDQAEVEAAQAAVRKARVDLGYTEIRAPLDGVVLQRNVEPGETVIANLQPPLLFRVASSLDQLDLVLRLEPRQVERVAEGDELRVEVPAVKKYRTKGKVVRVARVPEEEGGKTRYSVRIRVANDKGKLRPGMTGRAFLH